ncbi:unnamed protein product [Mytilus edulis]|uniref:Uncharacterized protein n=1 Tax=Mytilus edulis TaxID=6550 RepID=A0A8S3VJG9_MYTED|nr:unnamed protein product [Mytilus edulis]
MASKVNISCGPCRYEDISKTAKQWCTICEEGFCGEYAKTDQAQIQIPGFSLSIQNVTLKLQQKFDIKGSVQPISGCLVLPDDRIIIDDYNGSGKLIEYNTYVNMVNTYVTFVSLIKRSLTLMDTNRIAVTYGEFEYLEIINTKNTKERKRVNCSDNCWGISYEDQKLYVVVFQQGIVLMDLHGKTLNTIDIDVSWVINITTTSDRIYYTDNSTVHCCSMTGQELWVFKNQPIPHRERCQWTVIRTYLLLCTKNITEISTSILCNGELSH